MSVCDSELSRRRRRRRWPRKSLADIAQRLSTNAKNHKPTCDKPSLFDAPRIASPCFPFRDFGLSYGRTAVTSFDGCVAAPAGRFEGIERPYNVEDVLKLRGSFPIEHTLARRGALKLWELLHRQEPVRALGALSGNQAMQMVR